MHLDGYVVKFKARLGQPGKRLEIVYENVLIIKDLANMYPEIERRIIQDFDTEIRALAIEVKARRLTEQPLADYLYDDFWRMT